MNEHDLHGLGHSPRATIPDCRPIGDIVSRGTRLRRRQFAVRTAGATAMVGGFAAVSVLAVRDGPDMSTVPADPPRDLLPAPADGCGGYGEILPAADVDSLRMIPTELPDGIEVTTAEATRSVTDCVGVDPALILLSDATGATIHVQGPFATRPPLLQATPTELRGIEALMKEANDDGAPYFGFVWTEPDGGSWSVESQGADEATVRAVAEALLLSSTPSPEVPAAELPTESVPEGFGVLWQALGLPKTVREVDQRFWMVQTSSGACYLQASDGNGDAPMQAVMSGLQRTTVREHEALGKDSTLIWTEAPGVQFHLDCADQDLEAMRQMAESLEPIEVNDPRVEVNTDVGPINEEE